MATGIFSAGSLLGLLTTWQPYTVVALAVTGLLLVQSAFEAGPLRMSLPALTAAEPIAGIVCSIGLLGDRLRVTPPALAWEITGLIAVVIGVLLLGRHPAMPTGAAGPGNARGAPHRRPLTTGRDGRGVKRSTVSWAISEIGGFFSLEILQSVIDADRKDEEQRRVPLAHHIDRVSVADAEPAP
jgi:hypothetical protein